MVGGESIIKLMSLISVISHEVAILCVPVFAYVFGIFSHLLLLLSLYPYKLIDWWMCHHGSILPWYGRGKVVYEICLGVNIILKGEEVYDIFGEVWKPRFPHA